MASLRLGLNEVGRRLQGALRKFRAPWFRSLYRARKSVALAWTSPEAVARVDERYLSFSIDISVLAGGQWWEGSNIVRNGLGGARVEPLALDRPKLDRLTQALGPAYLRVGGSEADKIAYFDASTSTSTSTSTETGSGKRTLLTKAMWDALHGFVQRNELLLSFTFKYGLFERKHHGAWQPDEIVNLLRYTRQQGYRVDVFELGNELNAYWAFHGLASQPRARHLAADYARFAEVVREFFPKAKVIGPGSAFWPHLGETIKPFSNITHNFLVNSRKDGVRLDIVDWHYYPFQSRRSPVRTRKATKASMLHPRALNEFKKYCLQLKRMRDVYYPAAQLWTGETGSAQCGGEPKLSDRYASCFWWLDQLGLGALYGQQVMIRQSLVGGDYGLLDREALKPRPDYWASWLWKNLMGTRVFAVDSPHSQLRAYCHSSQRHREADGEGRAWRSLLLINLSARPCAIKPKILPGWFVHQRYVLSAKKLTSKKLRINGIKARLEEGAPPELSRFELERELPFELGGYELAPQTLVFFILHRTP